MTLEPQRVNYLQAQRSPALAILRQLQYDQSIIADVIQQLAQAQARLLDITDEPRWNVNVPFGSLASMPGQLVNTNTIQVRLGEDYVVEYSAKQARAVAARREAQLRLQLELVEEQIANIKPEVHRQLGLPDNFSVNERNEIVNESGLACFEIEEQETESTDPHQADKDATVGQHNAMARMEHDEGAHLTMDTKRVWSLLDQLEAEEEEEVTEEPEEVATEEQDEPDMSTKDLETDRPQKSKKFVSFDLPEERDATVRTLTPTTRRPASSPAIDKVRVNRDALRPIKDVVLERPLASTSKVLDTAAPTGQILKLDSAEKDEDEEEEDDDDDDEDDDDDDEDDDDDDEDDDENYEQGEDFDQLLMQRELALEYHNKRFDLLSAPGQGPFGFIEANSADADMYPLNASLAPGSKPSNSRFAGGRFDSAQLIIPTLLQQANLKPGDIVEDLPLNSRAFTEEELAIIAARAEALGELPSTSTISVSETNNVTEAANDTSEPATTHATKLEPLSKEEPVKTHVTDHVHPISAPSKTETQAVRDSVLERPMTVVPSDEQATISNVESKPKRVSRFKAGR